MNSINMKHRTTWTTWPDIRKRDLIQNLDAKRMHESVVMAIDRNIRLNIYSEILLAEINNLEKNIL